MPFNESIHPFVPWVTMPNGRRYLFFNPDANMQVTLESGVSPIVDLCFWKPTSSPVYITSHMVKGDRALTVSSTTGMSVGDLLFLFTTGLTPTDRIATTTITSIVGLNVVIDTPIDYEYGPGHRAISGECNLAVDGSITPIVFSAGVPVGVDVFPSFDINIHRVLMVMETTNPVDLNKFGDIIGGIINGVVLRTRNGDYHNIWNVKNNGDLVLLGYDVNMYSATHPTLGINGISWRYTFGGEDKHGAVVRIKDGESLDLIVQDDLSSIVRIEFVAQGHVVYRKETRP